MGIRCGQRSCNLRNRKVPARAAGSGSCQSKGPEKERKVTLLRKIKKVEEMCMPCIGYLTH